MLSHLSFQGKRLGRVNSKMMLHRPEVEKAGLWSPAAEDINTLLLIFRQVLVKLV